MFKNLDVLTGSGMLKPKHHIIIQKSERMHTFSNNSFYLYEHTQFHVCFTNIKCKFQGQESSDGCCVCRLKSFGLNADIVISMASCNVYKNVMIVNIDF